MKKFKDVKVLDKNTLKNVKGGVPFPPPNDGCPEDQLLCPDRVTCVTPPSDCPY